MNGAIKIILIGVVLVFLKYGHRAIFSHSQSSHTGKSEIMKQLESIARKDHRQEPYMINKETRVDSVGVIGSALVYNYTLVNIRKGDIRNKSDFTFKKKEKFKKKVCSDPRMEVFKDYDISVDYRLRDKIGNRITSILISMPHCNPPTLNVITNQQAN